MILQMYNEEACFPTWFVASEHSHHNLPGGYSFSTEYQYYKLFLAHFIIPVLVYLDLP